MIPRPRIALTPVSWGVFPQWGHVMDTERVLGEMRDLGVAATEVGPPGFLPAEPAAARQLLDSYGLRAVAGAVSIASIEPAQRDTVLAGVRRDAEQLRALGADVAITVLRRSGIPLGAEIGDGQWRQACATLDAVEDVIRDVGLRQALHPHVNSLVETSDDMRRIAEGSRCGWCFDTAHISAGGLDPVAFAGVLGPRITHIHLKDGHGVLGPRMVAHLVGFEEAVRGGVFQPLGEGAVPIADIIRALEHRDDAWWVLEQDMSVPTPPAAGEGPVQAVARSLAYALAG